MPDRELEKEIGRLRQFFRAVLNDQMLGDEVTHAVLASVDLAAVGALSAEQRRARLFTDAISVWLAARSATDVRDFSDGALLAAAGPDAGPGEQVLILTDVMGMSVADAAAALQISTSDARSLAADARATLDTDVHGSVMIIEDEPLIAEGIADLVRGMGAEVIAMVRSCEQAISQAEMLRPNAVLADFDLGGGGTGLDAVKAISADHDTIAIFITAFPEEVLTGEDYEPAFVLTKPYRERALRTALAYSLKAPRPELVE